MSAPHQTPVRSLSRVRTSKRSLTIPTSCSPNCRRWQALRPARMAARFTSTDLLADSSRPSLRFAKFASTRIRSLRNTTNLVTGALKCLRNRAATNFTANSSLMTAIRFSIRGTHSSSRPSPATTPTFSTAISVVPSTKRHRSLSMPRVETSTNLPRSMPLF